MTLLEVSIDILGGSVVIIRDDDYVDGKTAGRKTKKNTKAANEDNIKDDKAILEDNKKKNEKGDVVNAAFNLFSLSGRVEDYLLYKQIEKIAEKERG